MELFMLKTLFNQGALRTAAIIPEPIQAESWGLYVTTQTGQQVRLILANNRGTRVFKTLEAASQAASEIGFKTVSLTL